MEKTIFPKSMVRFCSPQVALIFGVLVLSFVVAFYAVAWTEPASAPPAGNISTPINTGVIDQVKAGGLGLGGALSVDWGTVLARLGGNVGIGTASPSQKLDVTGYVKGSTGLCIGADCRTSWPVGGIVSETDPQVGTLTNGKWCTSDGSLVNCSSNPPTTSGTYIGATPLAYFGDAGGYTGADAKCNAAFIGTRLCSAADFTKTRPTAAGRFNTFIPVEVGGYADCYGWTMSAGRSSVWAWDTSVPPKLLATNVNNCAIAVPLLCCQN